jgi:hypothetical protein
MLSCCRKSLPLNQIDAIGGEKEYEKILRRDIKIPKDCRLMVCQKSKGAR